MYTALAAQFETHGLATQFAATVHDICRPYGYQVIINQPDFDADTSEGVKVFQQKKDINLLICLNYPSHKQIKISSDLLFLELGYAIEPKYAGKETYFVELILKVGLLPGPTNLYWIFAYEWPQDRFVKFKSGSAVDLVAYLESNSWYWADSLYSIENDTYHLDLDTPLVFRITS
ncbi:hypothetical protein [Hymenobacter metallicola]|uniref:Uncharacterized protein n=1 Tax=Hymenobacter metallicola TaxID=2563114 RepID=A0A4Z0Q073_9BACT|nr:hypothetical protein [Hymenobacter metallicola]TGE23367.1 hypothetical protein E5K02_19420 [Hymenobacter metallicola]